jgi:hypothetical protein
LFLSFAFFCFGKKNVLVNDDKKGSSEKHYQHNLEKLMQRVIGQAMSEGTHCRDFKKLDQQQILVPFSIKMIVVGRILQAV